MIGPPSKEFDGDPRSIRKTKLKKRVPFNKLDYKTTWPSCKDTICSSTKSPISMGNADTYILEPIAADQAHLENGKLPATSQKTFQLFFQEESNMVSSQDFFSRAALPFLMVQKIHPLRGQ